MKLLKTHATAQETGAQLQTLVASAQQAFENRLKFAGTGTDQIHAGFDAGLNEAKRVIILDSDNIDGLVPALPSRQKKPYSAARKETIEKTCDFLTQVNDAVKAELGTDDTVTTDTYAEAFFRLIETISTDNTHQFHVNMSETIRHLIGSDVDTMAASIADVASPVTERNDRAKLTGAKKLAMFAPLALLLAEMGLSTYAIGTYTNKGIKAYANQPESNAWHNNLARNIDQTGGWGEAGVFVAVGLAVLGINKMVQAAGNEAVTRRKVAKLTQGITTPDLVEKNRLLARIAKLGGGVNSRGKSWAKTIGFATCAIILSVLAVKEPHTKGKITATVEQLEADKKAGDFVGQVATVLTQVEDAMKQNDATSQLVDSQLKAYLAAEEQSGKGAAYEAKRTALEGGTYTPPTNGKPTLVSESQARLSGFAGGPDQNTSTGLSAEYAGIIKLLKNPAETMNNGVLERLTELQSKIDNHTVELDDIKAVAEYIKGELEKLKTNLTTATASAETMTRAYEQLLKDLNDISNRAYPGRSPLPFSVDVAIANIDVDKLVADIMASVPKVEYLTAAELTEKLEELTKDQPGYAEEVRKTGALYGWTVEGGMRFGSFGIAALLILAFMISRNTKIGDYKKAFEQEDKLLDVFLGIINNPETRQYLTLPEGEVTRENIHFAIQESMKGEVAKREKEEDNRVRGLGFIQRVIRTGGKFKGWITNIRPQTDVGLEHMREGFAAMQGPDGKLRGEFISSVLAKIFGTINTNSSIAQLSKIIADAQAALKKEVAKNTKRGTEDLSKEDKKNIQKTYLGVSTALNEMENSLSAQLDFQSIPHIASAEADRIEGEIKGFLEEQRLEMDNATSLLSPADSERFVRFIATLRSRLDGYKAQITADVSKASKLRITRDGNVNFV